MAIRLRTVNGFKVALCAAVTKAEFGDTYLNNRDHEALAAKFSRDWRWNGLGTNLPVNSFLDPIMEKIEGLHEKAQKQLTKWLDKQGV